MKEETDPMGQNLDLPIVKIGDQRQNWRLPIIDRTTIPDNASSWSNTPLLGLGREKLRKSAKKCWKSFQKFKPEPSELDHVGT